LDILYGSRLNGSPQQSNFGPDRTGPIKTTVGYVASIIKLDSLRNPKPSLLPSTKQSAMKKRKQTPATKTTTGDGGATTSATLSAGDIKTLIRDYAAFFDDLIDRIPAKFYLPTADENKAWYQGLSKAAKAVAKQKSIENTKKARRDRLDPEKSTKTTEILKETLENERKDDDGGDGRSEVTLEDLHQRLQKRIAELRAARGGVEGGGRRKEAERREKDGKKRKREDEDSGKKKEEKKENSGDNVEKEVEAAAKGIEFGKVKLGAELDDGKNSY